MDIEKLQTKLATLTLNLQGPTWNKAVYSMPQAHPKTIHMRTHQFFFNTGNVYIYIFDFSMKNQIYIYI